MPLLPADFSHARPCKPFCENSLTLPRAGISGGGIFYGETNIVPCTVKVSVGHFDRVREKASLGKRLAFLVLLSVINHLVMLMTEQIEQYMRTLKLGGLAKE